MKEQVILYHVHDPMCSWCWGFKPTWDTLKQSLPDDIQVVNLLGGLAPDSDVEMPQQMQQYLQNTWHTIQDKLGTSFNFDFWSKQTPRRSTYPACRAVLAATWQNKEEEMITVIQQVYYLQAQNPSDLSTLENLAQEIDLDVEQFRRDMASDALNAEFQKQMTMARRLGINGFPSLVLKCENNLYQIPIDYLDATTMQQQIKQICEGELF